MKNEIYNILACSPTPMTFKQVRREYGESLASNMQIVNKLKEMVKDGTVERVDTPYGSVYKIN
jgi:DNA-binding HxlR family transcriptional regulator